MRPRRSAVGVALLYHRVTDSPVDPFGLAVTPEQFAAHLRTLRGMAPIVPVEELGRRAEPTIAITFDDGYADNFIDAAVLLHEFSLPATVFVSSEVIESEGEFWWDRLEHLLLDTRPESPHLEVVIDGQPLLVDVRTPDGCTRAVRALNRRLRVQPRGAIEKALDEIRAQTGTDAQPCERHRRATKDNIAHARRNYGIAVGAHTVTHTMLAALDRTAQEQEITCSRDALASFAGRIVDFAYPYGGHESFTDETTRLVAAAGFDRAFINVPGVVRRRTDQWRLPRLMVYGWPADELRDRVGALLSA